MQRKILIVIALFLGLAQAQADEVVINPDNPGTHVVVKGDTLWDISNRFYGTGFSWTKIRDANPGMVGTLPNGNALIHPGQVFRIPNGS